jgi:hypothetical protein
MRSARGSRNTARIECRPRGAPAPSFVGRRARRCVQYLQRSRDAMTNRAREMRVSRSSAMLRGCTNRDVGSLLRIRKTVRAEGV